MEQYLRDKNFGANSIERWKWERSLNKCAIKVPIMLPTHNPNTNFPEVWERILKHYIDNKKKYYPKQTVYELTHDKIENYREMIMEYFALGKPLMLEFDLVSGNIKVVSYDFKQYLKDNDLIEDHDVWYKP